MKKILDHLPHVLPQVRKTAVSERVRLMDSAPVLKLSIRLSLWFYVLDLPTSWTSNLPGVVLHRLEWCYFNEIQENPSGPGSSVASPMRTWSRCTQCFCRLWNPWLWPWYIRWLWRKNALYFLLNGENVTSLSFSLTGGLIITSVKCLWGSEEGTTQEGAVFRWGPQLCTSQLAVVTCSLGEGKAPSRRTEAEGWPLL